MKVWKDKEGNWITAREFSTRWKQGVEGITPLQQTKSTIFGYLIIALGVIWGLILAYKSRTWWLFIILKGSTVVTGTQFVGILQKYIILKKMEVTLNEV
jgi:hypothetical protein